MMKKDKNNHLVLKIVLGVAGGLLLAVVIICIVIGIAANKAVEEISDGLNDMRKADVKTVATAVTNYQMSNNGNLPTKATDLNNYLSNYFADPDGTQYEVVVMPLSEGAAKTVASFDHTFYILTNGKCGDGEAMYSSNKRDFVILYRLTDGATYCYE